MAKAFVFMRKKAVVYATDGTIEQLAKDYEAAMKEAAEQHSKAMKGKPKTEEHKKKLSEAHKGKHIGEKHSMYGKHHSDESKKKMSEAHKNMSEETRRKLSESHKGKPAWSKGKKFSEEHKKKMSEAHKNMSEEHRKKISEAKKGVHWFNNGKISIMSKECPEGFVPGRIK